jgi:hypothetical protein
VRSLPDLIATTGDLKHYCCPVCYWTWGSELPANKTECPVRHKHRALMKARKLREQQRRGGPISVGDLLTAAEDSGL